MGAGFELAGLFEANEDEPPMWRNVVTSNKRDGVLLQEETTPPQRSQ